MDQESGAQRLAAPLYLSKAKATSPALALTASERSERDTHTHTGIQEDPSRGPRRGKGQMEPKPIDRA